MELHVWCTQAIKPIHDMMGWCRALKLEIAELGGVVDQSAAITAVQDAQVVYSPCSSLCSDRNFFTDQRNRNVKIVVLLLMCKR
jgi:hypothetical protein